jgi:hypothetical protein
MQKDLRVAFEEITLSDGYDELDGFNRVAISIFDHWLTLEEYNEFLLNTDLEDRLIYLKSLQSFSSDIVKRFPVLAYRNSGRGSKRRSIYKSFLSEDNLIEYVAQKSTVSSGRFQFKLIIPNLSSVYMEGWDFTNYIYWRNEKDLLVLKGMAKDRGLFFLEV